MGSGKGTSSEWEEKMGEVLDVGVKGNVQRDLRGV